MTAAQALVELLTQAWIPLAVAVATPLLVCGCIVVAYDVWRRL